ncbi:ZWICHEL kinesin-like calmodulin-binding protein [Prunus dulcis]|uniref:ZWICHEL kinesin-like calmodulin-binding protein n=1 Tax=Prunus dulcis TaxID=3755 RepID=A0A4Y1QQP1_PRUDU|nr:ZWICHEL kinesin-like calmodulin-binding protein [Prunus dulcis]
MASSRLSSAAEPDRVLTSLEPSGDSAKIFGRKSRSLVSGLDIGGGGRKSVTRRDSLRFLRISGRVLSKIGWLE